MSVFVATRAALQTVSSWLELRSSPQTLTEARRLPSLPCVTGDRRLSLKVSLTAKALGNPITACQTDAMVDRVYDRVRRGPTEMILEHLRTLAAETIVLSD